MGGQSKCTALLVVLLVIPTLSGKARSANVTPTIGEATEAPNEENREPYGANSIAIEKALRTLSEMLRSSSLDSVISWMERKAGSNVAEVIRKHARTLADTLDDLAKWEEISLEIIRGQMVAALRGVGVSHSTARTVAFWLRNFIEWVLL